MLAIFYYKTAQKNFDGICALIDLGRGIIWLFVIASLIENISANAPLGVSYVLGGSVGDYISLKLETKIGKLIFRLKNKGRRKKRWYLQGERKI